MVPSCRLQRTAACAESICLLLGGPHKQEATRPQTVSSANAWQVPASKPRPSRRYCGTPIQGGPSGGGGALGAPGFGRQCRLSRSTSCARQHQPGNPSGSRLRSEMGKGPGVSGVSFGGDRGGGTPNPWRRGFCDAVCDTTRLRYRGRLKVQAGDGGVRGVLKPAPALGFSTLGILASPSTIRTFKQRVAG